MDYVNDLLDRRKLRDKLVVLTLCKNRNYSTKQIHNLDFLVSSYSV